ASSSIESSKLSNQAWRDSIFDVSGSKLSDAISTEFLYRVFEKLFVEHKQVSDENELKSILDTLLTKHNVQDFLGGSSTLINMAKSSNSAKKAVFSSTNEAQEKRIFGVPSFVTENNQVFWGNDHLVDAAVYSLDLPKKSISKL
ncbi:hypothetical protein AYI70_g11863, partial [Smittium culicis]